MQWSDGCSGGGAWGLGIGSEMNWGQHEWWCNMKLNKMVWRYRMKQEMKTGKWRFEYSSDWGFEVRWDRRFEYTYGWN